MNCSNGFCSNKGQALLLACRRCRQNRYCSQLCVIEDWNSGHSLVCEKNRLEHLRKIELESPFIKTGKLLSCTEADRVVPKDDVRVRYEPVEHFGSLGKGSFGRVALMREKATDHLAAVKTVNKCGVKDKREMQALLNEIAIQKRMVHENIIRLISHFEDSKNIYIVMEYAKKGSLFHLLRKKKKFAEKDAFFFFIQVCSAVHFLHTHHFMHRDIKPENLLVTEMGRLKLCDFGCCAKDDDKNRIDFCGTIEYMAPEVVRKERCDEKADVWSLGILLYEMLHGYTPYHGRNDKATVQMILNRKPRFFDIKDDVKDLINTMLNAEAGQRPEVWEVFLHPWVKRMQQEFGIPDLAKRTSRRASNTLLTGRANNRRNELNDGDAEVNKTQVGKGPISRSLLYHQKSANNLKALNEQLRSNKIKRMISSNEVNCRRNDLDPTRSIGKKEYPLTQEESPDKTPRDNPGIVSNVVIEREIESIYSNMDTSPHIEQSSVYSVTRLALEPKLPPKPSKGSESTFDECAMPKSEPAYKQVNSLKNINRRSLNRRRCAENFTEALEEVKESESNEKAACMVRISRYKGGTSKARRASVSKRGSSAYKTRNNIIKKTVGDLGRKENSIWDFLKSFGGRSCAHS
eukprot:TRINITY_DN1340_c0_g4_i1.p1 TRINITY_DN1340_c0_g4~~TRINITY_DN1340_c0_g4_i1.p1  ORF type:complete len:632 (-),score=114.18 TRINITY_DN1340_c0_g4_i1:130-2025(-)